MQLSDQKINVLLAGGRKLLREGLCLLLEKDPHIHVIAEADDGQDFPRLLRALSVNVVILHLSPPVQEGLQTIRSLRKARPCVRVIALTLTPAIHFVEELLQAGASACLTRECAGNELVAAVHRVARDEVYFSPGLVERVVTRYVNPPRQHDKPRRLAPRERQILRMIAAGNTTKEIAADLCVSTKTVETHRRRIMEKLNLFSVAELTKYAVVEGFTTLEASV